MPDNSNSHRMANALAQFSRVGDTLERLETKVDETHDIITGGRNPEQGLAFRMRSMEDALQAIRIRDGEHRISALEQAAERRNKVAIWSLGIAATAFFTTTFDMLKAKVTHFLGW